MWTPCLRYKYISSRNNVPPCTATNTIIQYNKLLNLHQGFDAGSYSMGVGEVTPETKEQFKKDFKRFQKVPTSKLTSEERNRKATIRSKLEKSSLQHCSRWQPRRRQRSHDRYVNGDNIDAHESIRPSFWSHSISLTTTTTHIFLPHAQDSQWWTQLKNTATFTLELLLSDQTETKTFL